MHKISEKFSQNSFFLKFHARISTEIGTKRDKFQVKRMSVHLRKKSNSFAHKRTFLSVLAVMNKKFIANLVGRIWGSNISQITADAVTNVWITFQTKILKEYGVVSPRPRAKKTGFPKTRRPGFSSPYLCTCLLTWVKIEYESTCVNFFTAIRTPNGIVES